MWIISMWNIRGLLGNTIKMFEVHAQLSGQQNGLIRDIRKEVMAQSVPMRTMQGKMTNILRGSNPAATPTPSSCSGVILAPSFL
jgi:hypothetical protein